ncbi:MAG: flagellar hook-basal body complex protein FliE [Candidatus Gastranaerophilales bacterium]|nr:flagellar hook-basal body complex protein FliE [Candidatus Gastranaerophilales bacterium]
MTNSFFYPKVDLTGRVERAPIDLGFGPLPSPGLDSNETKTSFKDVVTGLANNLNNDLNAPDKLLKSAMTGDSDVDIHDVMTAMAKAEISVSVATQFTSKVIQAYDKIMQISV